MKIIFYILLLSSFYLGVPSPSYGKENATWIKSTYLIGYDPLTKSAIRTWLSFLGHFGWTFLFLLKYGRSIQNKFHVFSLHLF
jgi:hypothetical protein